MAPKATTGIVLRQAHRTGQFKLTRDEGRTIIGQFPEDRQLHQIAWAAGLTNGYWLRGTPEVEQRDGKPVMVATVWTWVQL